MLALANTGRNRLTLAFSRAVRRLGIFDDCGGGGRGGGTGGFFPGFGNGGGGGFFRPLFWGWWFSVFGGLLGNKGKIKMVKDTRVGK